MSAQRAGSTLGLALGGGLALAAAMGVGRFVYTPILPPMAEGLGLGPAASGLVAAANFAGYLAGALGAAVPLPGGRRAWLVGSLLASATTTAAMGLASAVPVLAALRFAGGVASAFVFVFATGLVLQALDAAGRGERAALVFAGVGLGIAGSAMLVSLLMALGIGWRGLWFASGAVALAATLAVARLVGDPPPGRAPSGVAAGARDGRFGVLVLAYGLFGFGYVITMTFLVAIVRATPALRPFEPFSWVLAGLAAAPSPFLWNAAARRLGTTRTFALAAFAEAAGVAASVVAPSLAGLAAAAILVGGTFVGMTALGIAAARARAPGDTRRAIALMTASFGAGQIVGPAYAGFASERFGGFLVPSLTAVAALLVAGGLVLAIERPPASLRRRARGTTSTGHP